MLGVLAREVLITAKVSSFVLLLRTPEINPTRRFLSLTAAKPDKLPHALSQSCCSGGRWQRDRADFQALGTQTISQEGFLRKLVQCLRRGHGFSLHMGAVGLSQADPILGGNDAYSSVISEPKSI